MITEYIRYRVPETSAAAFEAAYARAATILAASPDCIDFELAHGHDEPARYVLRIRWSSLEGHLDGFRRSEAFAGFLDEVRPYLDDIEEMAHYVTTAVVGEGGATERPPTLYEWAGGADAFQALFERFYAAVVQDELLEPLFGGMSPDHPAHVAVWLGEVFGGPPGYSEDHGGYEAMLAHHLGLGITEAQRRRWVSLLLDAADEVGLPADPEFRSAFVAYLEWGTRLAVENSRPGATPPPRAPVPRWGWGVAPPWSG